MASKRMAAAGKNRNTKEWSVSATLDDLSDLQEFKDTVLPAIRQDLKAGMTAAEIRKKYAAIVQASMVTTALIDQNATARLAAGKDILDRDEGRAKENKTVEHRFSHLSDDQLNAILVSEEADIADEEDTEEHA